MDQAVVIWNMRWFEHVLGIGLSPAGRTDFWALLRSGVEEQKFPLGSTAELSGELYERCAALDG